MDNNLWEGHEYRFYTGNDGKPRKMNLRTGKLTAASEDEFLENKRVMREFITSHPFIASKNTLDRWIVNSGLQYFVNYSDFANKPEFQTFQTLEEAQEFVNKENKK